MPKPRFRKRLVCLITFLGFALYTATRGNVRWRIHRHYPSANVALRAEGNPESSFCGVLCRGFGLRYFSPSETVGVRISGHSAPIDFTDFRGMLITYLTLDHCVITDIHPLLTMYRAEVSFLSCDISRLPDDQKRFLHYQPEFDRYSIFIPSGEMPQYPGGFGLHSENFYP